MNKIKILKERKEQIYYGGKESIDGSFDMKCEKHSLAGSVSQRACVFCGSRVVLYPIVDALHLVHGPIGCAAYTWDIRGALSSGPRLHRLSFSTDLREKNIIFGGEKKLYKALCELIDRYSPKAAFVYATCIVGIIGDDIDSICKRVSKEKNIPVLSVHSEGFKGTKKDGYRAACEALACLVGTGPTDSIGKYSINILGDFNIAGETWMIKEYYRCMGVEVVATITGDGRIADICKAHGAKLNVVQCSGSMLTLAKIMEKRYGIPFIRVSYLGAEDTADALYQVARFFKNERILLQTKDLVNDEVRRLASALDEYRRKLAGKKAAIYVGGAFKAVSLIKALNSLEMKAVVVGSQTGNKDDYRRLKEMCGEGTIIIDDANPLELSKFALEKGVDIFIGGVKERPLAYKLGIGFCDHNHQRKSVLAGFSGMLNFAHEVYSSIMSPVWRFVPGREQIQGKG